MVAGGDGGGSREGAARVPQAMVPARPPWAAWGSGVRRLARGVRRYALFVARPGLLGLTCCLRKRVAPAKKDDLEEVELGGTIAISPNGSPKEGAFRRHVSPKLQPALTGNFQDADDCAFWAPEPILVVALERRQEKGVRIPKGVSLVLPDAGRDLVAKVAWHLPSFLQIRQHWYNGYSMAVDGVSLRTLFRQVAEAGPTLLVIEDSEGCLFGAFCSEGLRPRSCFSGTPETFAFRCPRAAGAWHTEIFQCTATTASSPSAAAMASRYSAPLVYCDHRCIIVGQDDPAIYVSQDLLRGSSHPCRVFASPTLSTTADFVVRNLEVWHFSERAAQLGSTR